VPRSLYVPSPFFIVQTPGYVVILLERMSWRIIPMDGRPHLPDAVRLWQGDSLGRWDGDTLVVETANLKWQDVAQRGRRHRQPRGTRRRAVHPGEPGRDSSTKRRSAIAIVYTRPWTIGMPLKRRKSELLEVACLEDNQDLLHLKDVRDGGDKQ